MVCFKKKKNSLKIQVVKERRKRKGKGKPGPRDVGSCSVLSDVTANQGRSCNLAEWAAANEEPRFPFLSCLLWKTCAPGLDCKNEKKKNEASLSFFFF